MVYYPENTEQGAHPGADHVQYHNGHPIADDLSPVLGNLMKQLKKSKRHMVVTVKGKAAAVVQDSEAYQRLLDIAARADAEEGIRQGLEDARAGRVRPGNSSPSLKPHMACPLLLIAPNRRG